MTEYQQCIITDSELYSNPDFKNEGLILTDRFTFLVNRLKENLQTGYSETGELALFSLLRNIQIDINNFNDRFGLIVPKIEK